MEGTNNHKMNSLLKFPIYAKASLLIIGMYVLISMLYIAQDLILPLVYSIIFSILMSPVVNFLVRKKINRAVAITIVLALVILTILMLVFFLIKQVTLMRDSLPQVTEKFQELYDQLIKWISNCFDIRVQKINTWISHKSSELLNNSDALIGVTFTTMSGVLTALLLTPVYTFMILIYETHLISFGHQLVGKPHNATLKEISSETKTIVQSYLLGLMAEFGIIAILNSLGLMILGIKYAILLGILGAFLNIIPYIGGIIGVAIFAIIALVTKSPVYVLYVIALYTLIQFIDNNFIVPKIVGAKVKLNAFVSMLAVIAGAALWGIPGMFLSIPITAIMKVVFDRFESLRPWAYLMGDDTEPMWKMKPKVKKQ